mmetsp:Transcript_47650/g.137140  ORF Transcript_47650/g.137140 Transcript_47650/m.137140 type:complete len:223 (+) Transcript_47650:240-908(+)
MTSRPTADIRLQAVLCKARRRCSSSRGARNVEEPALGVGAARGGEADMVASTASLALFCRSFLVLGSKGSAPSPFMSSNIIGEVRNSLPIIFVAGVSPNFMCRTPSFLHKRMASADVSSAPKLAYMQSGSKTFITKTFSRSTRSSASLAPLCTSPNALAYCFWKTLSTFRFSDKMYTGSTKQPPVGESRLRSRCCCGDICCKPPPWRMAECFPTEHKHDHNS